MIIIFCSHFYKVYGMWFNMTMLPVILSLFIYFFYQTFEEKPFLSKLFRYFPTDSFQKHIEEIAFGLITINQGPVVQSIVSLMSSLRVISLTVLADSIYNILIFFAEKM